MAQPVGGGGAIVLKFPGGSRLCHELYIDRGDADANTDALAHFRTHRSTLEAAYGRGLRFEELPGKRACRIADYRDNADVRDVDRHDEFIGWLLDAGVRLRRALAEVPQAPNRPFASGDTTPADPNATDASAGQEAGLEATEPAGLS